MFRDNAHCVCIIFNDNAQCLRYDHTQIKKKITATSIAFFLKKKTKYNKKPTYCYLLFSRKVSDHWLFYFIFFMF